MADTVIHDSKFSLIILPTSILKASAKQECILNHDYRKHDTQVLYLNCISLLIA